jgi:16S rRNA (guanine(527)-N(7))-methyltransferase RsmG
MHAHIGDWALLEQATAWGVALDSHTRDLLLRYLTLLYEANQRVNLTRVPAEQAVGRHLVDSLCLLAVYTPPEGARVLDIGTGAGLPGVPLAIVRPDLRLTLLDSHGKTVQFLQEVCAVLELNATVVQARAEEWAHNPDAREQFDVAVARAVAKMPILTELMTPFLKVGGVGLPSRAQAKPTRFCRQPQPHRGSARRLKLHTVSFETEQGPSRARLGCCARSNRRPASIRARGSKF